jgi:hypothetical protein
VASFGTGWRGRSSQVVVVVVVFLAVAAVDTAGLCSDFHRSVTVATAERLDLRAYLKL